VVTQADIYSCRRRLDLQRQPQWEASIVELHTLLLTAGLTHPYGPGTGRKLVAAPVFLNCGAGLFAQLTGEFCYRISHFVSLVRFTRPVLFNPLDTDISNWNLVQRDSGPASDWVPLSRYSTGSLSGPRGFTWWTPREPKGDLLTVAHMLGMPNDWAPYYGAVLRCRKAYLESAGLISVPTIIHGYDSEVFCATKDDDNPAAGMTIYLRSGELGAGVEEVVAEAIPVSEIELFPMSISDDDRGKDTIWIDDLLPALLNYYEEQITS
jgi:hypothetical protein